LRKGKVSPTFNTSVGARDNPSFKAVSLQAMSVTSPAVGCHYQYFTLGLQSPSHPYSITTH